MSSCASSLPSTRGDVGRLKQTFLLEWKTWERFPPRPFDPVPSASSSAQNFHFRLKSVSIAPVLEAVVELLPPRSISRTPQTFILRWEEGDEEELFYPNCPFSLSIKTSPFDMDTKIQIPAELQDTRLDTVLRWILRFSGVKETSHVPEGRVVEEELNSLNLCFRKGKGIGQKYWMKLGVVVGCGDYLYHRCGQAPLWGRLPRVDADVEAVGDLLSSMGYSVVRVVQSTKRQATETVCAAVRRRIEEGIRETGETPEGVIVALYYGGHGCIDRDTERHMFVPLDYASEGYVDLYEDVLKVLHVSCTSLEVPTSRFVLMMDLCQTIVKFNFVNKKRNGGLSREGHLEDERGEQILEEGEKGDSMDESRLLERGQEAQLKEEGREEEEEGEEEEERDTEESWTEVGFRSDEQLDTENSASENGAALRETERTLNPEGGPLGGVHGERGGASGSSFFSFVTNLLKRVSGVFRRALQGGDSERPLQPFLRSFSSNGRSKAGRAPRRKSSKGSDETGPERALRARGTEVFVATACEKGQTASGGTGRLNSYFVLALKKHLRLSLPLPRVFVLIRGHVQRVTEGMLAVFHKGNGEKVEEAIVQAPRFYVGRLDEEGTFTRCPPGDIPFLRLATPCAEQTPSTETRRRNGPTCGLCGRHGHTTENHRCRSCGEVGTHLTSMCTKNSCSLCFGKHPTAKHRCHKCRKEGLHRTQNCPQNAIEDPCGLCGSGDHPTEGHKCFTCKQLGLHRTRDCTVTLTVTT
uniref:CCHC-type domain-containing protein n=1 Tax=Chromera velia CCMP2878 TaxID=1169474 RepID=A0A0G4F5W1_9ALVE|eukprot:Cvel_15389.t1-p1 / transcript=Cvel_15389.t1 / gene=Cvel_15389 / organism=Chromera_velia_CCMP2878 / gene_product=Cellular nucleic acid-binding protein homolog, putative / transcript_product=Cellular nucleic acid-binding protein homolog, putative / location=Cvel_scaffold1136:15118-18629(-) / protein_length=753 / sequence_SO=supercontig / SO=protein_coding / is_pseudo=false